MYRTLILGAFCLITCGGLFAQRVQIDQVFGLGATIADFSGSRNIDSAGTNINSIYSFRIKQYGLVYGPKVDFVNSKDFSISLSTPLFVGISTTNKFHSINYNGAIRDTTDGLRGTRFAFELPAFVDFNFGLHSASDPSSRGLGLFAGAGYSYSYTTVKTKQGSMPFDRWEPSLRAGIRMGSSWEKRWSIVFTMRGEFEKSSQKAYGLQILKDL